ncbi:hypothetical protein [Ruegeria sp. EL01]|jgi:hypothetical protein|uniref:hypothetical protein n=1 Tax=Ruegeria sp. EL01 TaxID=2107578 RepID=UPI000EA81895|nr:hypothetical protein [Ruegeria sp. EL01]
MSETALSEATMLASLRDIRLPPDAAGGVLAELALAAGMAALAAMCVVAVLRLLSVERQLDQTIESGDAHPEMSEWTEARRRIALLHKLRQQDAECYAALKGDLYRPDGGPKLNQLEEEVARRV